MPLVTSAFDAAFAAVIGVEGAYSSDPSDPGNWTGGVVGSGKLREQPVRDQCGGVSGPWR